MRLYTTSTAAFACLTRSCAPPPVGRGGSSAGSGGGGRGLPDIKYGNVKITYEPDYPDNGPDPGEIVWAKVHFEDDPSQSKDRPVLVIGRINGGKSLAAVQLTSKTDKVDSMPIGPGTWDRDRRPSAVKLDRIVQIPAEDYRREGAVMPRAKFGTIVNALGFVQSRRARGK